MLYKYPSTPHLPWSPGLQNDDRRIESLDFLRGSEVVITEKMDGENASLYRDHYHARSLDSRHHPSRDWIKQFYAQVSYKIPSGWRVCGENLYAQHSIVYTDLDSYFLGFSIWDSHNTCLGWDETLEWFDYLGIIPVPEIYRGPWDEDLFKQLGVNLDTNTIEGYVVRTVNSFHFDYFSKYIAKFVRKGHVQTDKHWMSGPVIPNSIKEV